MNSHQQTAMDFYGLTEWPPSHMRKYPFPDCRGMACELMRKDGMLLENISLAVGFADHTGVRDALSRREAIRLKEMGHLAALVHCMGKLTPYDIYITQPV